MDNNLTLVLIVAAVCLYLAIRTIANAWAERSHCDCKNQPTDDQA